VKEPLGERVTAVVEVTSAPFRRSVTFHGRRCGSGRPELDLDASPRG
jgi:hypothetical protein